MRVFRVLVALLLAHGAVSEHQKKTEHVGLSRRAEANVLNLNAAITELINALGRDKKCAAMRPIQAVKNLRDGVKSWTLQHNNGLLVEHFDVANYYLNEYIGSVLVQETKLELERLWNSVMDSLKNWNILNIAEKKKRYEACERRSSILNDKYKL